eukprot:Pgem_evm1s15220
MTNVPNEMAKNISFFKKVNLAYEIPLPSNIDEINQAVLKNVENYYFNDTKKFTGNILKFSKAIDKLEKLHVAFSNSSGEQAISPDLLSCTCNLYKDFAAALEESMNK